MKAFMDKDFLLSTETSKKLFHEYAETMPIVDYHCHINPQEIAEDRKFENITQVWLGGDHYKWRQMRSNGVDEYSLQVVPVIVKNSRNGQKLLGKQSEIRSITGAIWNCRDISDIQDI